VTLLQFDDPPITAHTIIFGLSVRNWRKDTM